MKRREFLSCAAAVSAAAYTGEAAAKTTSGEQATPDTQCKITVIKKTVFQDLYKKYGDSEGRVCSVFEEGQEFLMTRPYNPPEGFCAWAWADIRAAIHAVQFGGRESSVACCTDGYRPVVFHVERIET
jgi:uncharacterized repeat protein (TIGR04076 family)